MQFNEIYVMVVFAAGTEGRGRSGTMESVLISLQVHDRELGGVVLHFGANLHVDKGSDSPQGTTNLECVGAPSLWATWKDVLFLVNNENYSSAGRFFCFISRGLYTC